MLHGMLNLEVYVYDTFGKVDILQNLFIFFNSFNTFLLGLGRSFINLFPNKSCLERI